MDDIIKAITEKTGMSEEQATQAAEAAISVIKDKLPAPIAGQLDGLLGGSGGGIADMAKKGLGGLLG